ncbi:hypothetical protein ILUMI_22208 [Ignelater luminosus]|uniref:CLIP domain-containing serine protease n=1 Tax=Ignelater luminosus TaxID=2038154 RepID=A0A8K0FXH6_IGNLU|nr:hypothetical protein ILUMI_22208 [Ignelater luminosus]
MTEEGFSKAQSDNLPMIDAKLHFVGRGDKCITPNGETATCQAITDCYVIRIAAVKREQGAKEFTEKSYCGRDTLPLVCCGTVAKFSEKSQEKPCTTPNGEPAKCILVSTCPIILNAILSLDEGAEEFAKLSQCGYGNEGPMVCCGSEAYPLRTNLLPNRTVCGVAKTSDERIYAGTITEIWAFPWMALLRYNYNNSGSDAGYNCVGTLINSRYVLTAAHCVSLRSHKKFYLASVRLGEWKISTHRDCEESANTECVEPVIDLNIEEAVVHPKYTRKTGENDIALLRLAKNVKFSDYIRPICLPVRESPDPSPESEMYALGWGITENDTKSDYKLKVKLPIVKKVARSNKILSSGTIGVDRICAGGKREKDSCYVDSGGPLMGTFTGENVKPRYYQEGIVLRGNKCGIGGFPGVYTRVAKYMDWIIQNLKSF